MKILLVSMNSIHFLRWTDQLKDSGHDVYWFDILDGGYSGKISWVKQFNGWRHKNPNLKGRHFFKKRLPFIYKFIKPLLERNVSNEFEKVLLEVKPDLVHSFVLYISCAPILKVMQKNNKTPWLYSSWGSDLFYFRNIPKYKKDIKNVLPRVNYLITDCKRDVGIAKELGFAGKVLGTFPGGGGFDFNESDKYIVAPASERHTILVKGYQGRSGRSITVLKALMELEKELKNYKVIVFGADDKVVKFANKNKIDSLLNISIYSINKMLPHTEIMKLMGESLIYIGNSNSDGMPNTLLEAIAMGAFPIQSNPGGASEEVITHNENGLLIQDCENDEEIMAHVLKTISNSKLIERAFIINQMEIKPKYERVLIENMVLGLFDRMSKKPWIL